VISCADKTTPRGEFFELGPLQGVRGMIIRVSDQLRCGEISLFKVNREEAEAAKARLDAPRKKRRESYPKNQDRIHAGQRETFALKNLPNHEPQFLF
jgi:hypothetical protein